ncbi:MAG: alpha-L-rhamnosidase C-terminal domain-containing protein, partial [Anaerotignum sp.]
FGFQYAEVETDIDFEPEDFKAIAVYSDMEQVGYFECSNAKVNRFFQNTMWSMKSNFLDIPTDCPQRERLGWTGDGQVFFETAHYIMDAAPVYRKWLHDFSDAQMDSGKLSAVIPYAGMAMTYDNTGASVGWGESSIIIPYRFWKRFDDETILHDFYDLMRNYAMFIISNTGHKSKKAAKENPYNRYVYEKGLHLGEWLEPKEFQDTPTSVKTEECTAYLHYAMRLMAEVAEMLKKTEDATLFKEYADGAKKAYNYMFVKNGIIDTDRQAKLVRPLALGLLDGESKKNVQNRLVRAVENQQYCVGTGFLSTPFILQMLTEAERSDVAFKMLENEKAPSWLAEVNAGATTVWENWDGSESRNHYSPGSICAWLFDTIAGIRMCGTNHFLIAPMLGGTLTFASAKYVSLYGKVATHIEKNINGYIFEVSIPVNTTAEIKLPNGEKHSVSTGKYVYTF